MANLSDKKLVKLEEYQMMETLENLFKFKNESLFTDVYIYVEGVEFPCHKVILCAASSYFKAMFSCDLKESRLGKVFIENISPWTMKRLLDYIYTGKIEINYENVIDVFNAAVMFQLANLAESCTDYIQQHIDLSNVVEINLFSSIHNLTNLETKTFEYILENFMQLLNHSTDNTEKQYSDLVKLNEKTFVELIKSDLLNVSREIYVYHAISKWIEYYSLINSKTNQNKLAKINQTYVSLFKYLRLNALSSEEIDFILKNDKFVAKNDYLLNQVNKFVAADTSEYSSFKKRNSLNDQEKINLPISNNNNNNNNKRSSIDDDSNQLKLVMSLKEPKMNSNIRPSTIPREYLCYMNLDQFQFYDFYKSKWDSLNSWQTLLAKNSSTTIKQIKQLNGYSICIIDNCLYVIGGHLIINDSYSSSSSSSSSSNPSISSSTSSSCCLSNSNSLTSISSNSSPPLSLSPIESSASASSLSTQDKTIREINLKKIELVDSVFKFDPIKNEWSRCKTMINKRAFHTSLSISSKYIFLFYGICQDSFDKLAQSTSIEFYNIETDSWSILEQSNNFLLNHHFYPPQSFNQYTRTLEIDDMISNFISLQLNQAKSIVSFKNLIYILNKNCIHCYEFNDKQLQLICLPYFQLPIASSNLNFGQFILAKAVTENTSSTYLCHSDNENDNENESDCCSSLSKSKSSSTIISLNNDCDNINSIKKEALIYLLNPQQSILYEFYPDKNKLKKLPNLLLKHATKETFILNIKSKLYVTGGILNNEMDLDFIQSSAIEVFDKEANSWSIFMPNLDNTSHVSLINLVNQQQHQLNQSIPLTKHFFKLKMTLI